MVVGKQGGLWGCRLGGFTIAKMGKKKLKTACKAADNIYNHRE